MFAIFPCYILFWIAILLVFVQQICSACFVGYKDIILYHESFFLWFVSCFFCCKFWIACVTGEAVHYILLLSLTLSLRTFWPLALSLLLVRVTIPFLQIFLCLAISSGYKATSITLQHFITIILLFWFWSKHAMLHTHKIFC